jgi:hypothetical protein
LRYLNAVSTSLRLPISRGGLLAARVAWVDGAVEKLANRGISAFAGNGEKQLQPAHRRNFSGNDDALADGCVGRQVAVTQLKVEFS